MSKIKFDFSKSTIQTKEELAKAMEGSGGDLYLKPGIHEVTIQSVKATGPAKSDASWQKLEVVYENVSKKTIRETVMVPTSKLEFDTDSGKTTLFPFQKLSRFVTAIGLNMGETMQSVASVLTEAFSNPEKTLVGMPLKITVGYQGNYLKYNGKNADGQTQYVIENARDGSTLAGKDGKSLVFLGVDAAKAHCDQNQIKYEGFPNVIGHDLSATPRGKTASNW